MSFIEFILKLRKLLPGSPKEVAAKKAWQELVELGASVRAEPQCFLLRDRELPLFLNEKIIALWAFRLPLFEQLESKEAHN